MNRKNNFELEQKFEKIFFSIFTFMFIVAMNYLALSPSGVGLVVTPNVAVWFCIAMLVLVSIFKVLLTEKIKYSKLSFALLLSLVTLVAFGLIETKSDNREVLLRISQVIGFYFLYFALSQYTLSKRKINLLFYIVIYAALFQIIYGLIQLHHNSNITPQYLLFFFGINSPPIGGLLQVNMMSMFLVMSIVISFYLASQSSFQSKKIINKIVLFSVMLGGGYLVAVISSRASILALAISIPLILVSRWNGVLKYKKWTAILFISLVAGFSYGAFESGYKKLSHKKMVSRSVAWGITVEAIKQKPIFGYGLGGFKKAFYDENEEYSKKQNEGDYKVEQSLGHPHNEILYWLAESGIAGVICILSFLLFYLFHLLKLRWRYSLQYIALLFPLVLHSQVSLPFYLSTILLVLFTFILVLPLRRINSAHSIRLSENHKKSIIVFSLVIFFSYSWFLKETLRGGVNLTKFGISGLKDYSLIEREISNPYWGKLSQIYFHKTLMEIEFQRNNKNKSLIHLKWFEEQVKTNEGRLYYKYILEGYSLFNDKLKLKELRQRLDNRYPSYFNE